MLISYYRHELHTCLNAIIGYSELLREDAQSSGITAVENSLGEIIAASRALLVFAKDFLSAGRLRELAPEALTGLTQKMYLAGQAPIQQIVTTCTTLIAAAEQAGQYNLIPDLCKIQASANVLQNLLETHNSALTTVTVGRESAPESHVLAAPSAAASSAKILIVDDNSMNRDLLRQWLERRGYFVEEASGGQQCLEYVQEQTYDLVLLDLRMPDLSGIAVLKELKAQGRMPQLPVVVLSASEELNEVATCIEYGALDYLVKPVNLAILDLRIRSYLERHRQQQLAAPEPIGGSEVTRFPDVTVLYAELHDESRLYTEHSAGDFVAHLRRVSALCDVLTARHAVKRVAAASDAYVAVAGLATAQTDHAAIIAALASALRSEVAQLNRLHGLALGLSMGVHSGPLLAGVLDGTRPVYGIWGETCRRARRLVAAAPAGEIFISAATRNQLGTSFRSEECMLAAEGIAYALQRTAAPPES